MTRTVRTKRKKRAKPRSKKIFVNEIIINSSIKKYYHKSAKQVSVNDMFIEVKSSTTSCGTWLEPCERALHPMSPLFILLLYGKTNTKLCFCVRFCQPSFEQAER
jgi:hypothetical protein